MLPRTLIAVAALSAAGISVVQAGEGPVRTALSQACEIAVARSAAPSRLREDASVYVLTDGKYRKAIDGDGPLTCIVERNHLESVVPQCMDRAGLDSVLPSIIDRSERILAGADPDEVEQMALNPERIPGRKPAERPGISYMMSDYTYTYVASAQGVVKIPPHVMFYAPGVTNEDIGGSFQGMTENIGTPFVFREGMHGYMIVYTEHRADPNEVARACGSELGAPPVSFDPFPKG